MAKRDKAEFKGAQKDDQPLKQWLQGLYAMKDLDDATLGQLHEAFMYKGFNRDEVLTLLKTTIPDQNLVIQLIVVSALRGPKAAGGIKLLNGKTPNEMGIPSSGGKSQKKLTLSKIVAATADIAAHFLKRMNAPKRIASSPLPGWLQFPAAGSITMPQRIRDQHREFSVEFSKLIKGEFNQNIYDQMTANSYLDVSLKLFE